MCFAPKRRKQFSFPSLPNTLHATHIFSPSSDQRLAKGSKTNRKVRLQVCQTDGAEMRFSTEELFFSSGVFFVVAFGNVRKNY